MRRFYLLISKFLQLKIADLNIFENLNYSQFPLKYCVTIRTSCKFPSCKFPLPDGSCKECSNNRSYKTSYKKP